jgi:CheY-like chemotaxis protein
VLRGTPVTLPRQAVPARQPAATLAPEPAAADAGDSRARLLVAEDNAANRRLLDAILADKGYVIDMVENGAEAVARAAECDYQVMLFDIAMPEMGGIEATQRIRAGGGRNADTPIVAITANAMRGDRERYLAAGMDDYVAKPIAADLLLDKLDHWAVSGRAAARRTGT